MLPKTSTHLRSAAPNSVRVFYSAGASISRNFFPFRELIRGREGKRNLFHPASSKAKESPTHNRDRRTGRKVQQYGPHHRVPYTRYIPVKN
jgi:hypothetical protein